MVIDLLKNLIAIDSSTVLGANNAVDFCGKWLRERGLKVSFYENNGYKMLVSEIGEGEHTLILNGHVDVVAGSPRQFTPLEKDGRIYGRGSADMKAGVAAMMAAFAQLSTREPGCKVQLQIVSDEEIGGMNCSGFLVENGYRGDFVICGEPTGLRIANQAKGILRMDITVFGKSAHGSRPWEGINAIEKAYDVYQQILDLPFAKEHSEYYESPSINLAKIKAGSAYNVVSDECKLGFDIRYLPTQNKDEIIRQIGGINGIEAVPGMSAAPINTSRNHPLLQRLADIVGRETGQEASFFGQHGTADTVYFAKYGIPAVEFGPGGGNWHGEDEFVEIDTVHAFEKILIELGNSGKIF